MYQEKTDPDVIKYCTNIGKKIFDVLPSIAFKRGKTIPVLIRIDFACCKNNKGKKVNNYFVNEIESDIAGLYINFKNVKYPALDILMPHMYKRQKELIK